MKALGKTYKDAEARTDGGFERLPAGGYVCKIVAVEDKPEKSYLSIVYDIAEGDRKGFYSDDWGKEHPVAHRFVASYKDSALGMFKGRLKAIDESNGTAFADAATDGLNENGLVGKLVGLVIGYEEYISDRGEIRQRSYVKNVLPVEKIRKGEYKVPDLKVLTSAPIQEPAGEAPEGFSWGNDVPF